MDDFFSRRSSARLCDVCSKATRRHGDETIKWRNDATLKRHINANTTH